MDCAVRAWRLKYPSSKTDDCAAVCLFLDGESSNLNPEARDEQSTALPDDTVEKTVGPDTFADAGPDHDPVLDQLGTPGSNEIVPVSEPLEEKLLVNSGIGQSKRSLAECIANREDEEWLALEGFARANSLLSLPRFLSGDSRSTSWRKWL